MKALGFILIIIGVAMILMRQLSFTTEKEVVDLGPVEINKKEKKTIGWPVYAGIGVAAVGAVVLVASSRKNS